ncbi:MAG TPA: hypothetical protein VFT22_32525 [Kofleriaceae bacterium]|nr:hypothetical protein [Kofleriaceae bacterium]
MRSPLLALVAALLAGAASAAGCTSSDVSRAIGARCDRTADCDERCLLPGNDFPGGFCTIACASRDGCPSATTCADREGGVCLFECAADPDCAFLGAGWRCSETDLRGGGIQVKVCSGQ